MKPTLPAILFSIIAIYLSVIPAQSQTYQEAWTAEELATANTAAHVAVLTFEEKEIINISALLNTFILEKGSSQLIYRPALGLSLNLGFINKTIR